MPQWRKLHVKATESFDINDMPDDFTRLLWVMLPLKLDSAGRGIDNPSWIKSQIMPLRTDVTIEMVSAAMDWYANRGMIQRYQVNGRAYFQVPTFEDYQGNTGREAPSHLPPPPSPDGNDLLTTNSRPTHDQLTQGSSTDSDVDSDADAETDSTPSASHEPAPARAMFSALAALCQIDLKTLTQEQRGALNQTEKILREAGAAPADLPEFGAWWHTYDWRGKRGETAQPHQVREVWGKFISWRESLPPPPVLPDSDGLRAWWQERWPLLAQFHGALRGAIPLSRDNGTLRLQVPMSEHRAHIERSLARIEDILQVKLEVCV